jgi:hypothetical protein
VDLLMKDKELCDTFKNQVTVLQDLFKSGSIPEKALNDPDNSKSAPQERMCELMNLLAM